MRGKKAKQLRRIAESVSGKKFTSEVEYQIEERLHNIEEPNEYVSINFKRVGVHGYYRWLKRRYKKDLAFRRRVAL